jgi:hypothetical protein
MKILKRFIKKILTVFESDEAKKLASRYNSLLPENNQKNREKIADFIIQYSQGKIERKNLEPTLKILFMVLPSFTEKEKEDILKINMEVFLDIKKDSDFTNDEFDIYREIIDYIHKNRQIEVKILLKKAAQKINSKELNISKETIDFIAGITDEKLQILKKIFRYVLNGGILNYKNIIQDFQEMNFCQAHSDNLKFSNRIFVNQDAKKGYNYKLETAEVVGILSWKNATLNEESLKKAMNIEGLLELKKFLEKDFKFTIFSTNKIKFYITKQPVSAGTIELNMKCFAILTEIGVEMYSLLEDEIESYPIEYLDAIVNDEKYKDFGLIYEIQS